MPVYNSAKFLADAAKMIQQQTEMKWELIFVNDCSTDESEKIIKKLQLEEPRIVYFKNEVNMGPSFSRNKAIDVARGKWVAIIDADDYIESKRLEIMTGHANEKGYDMVADNQKIEYSDGKSRTLLPIRYSKSASFEVDMINFFKSISKVKSSYTFGMVQPVIRTDFLNKNKIRFNEKIRYGEDAAFVFDCLAQHARFSILTEAMYTVRKLKVKGVRQSYFAYRNQKQLNQYFNKQIKSNNLEELDKLLLKRRINILLRFIMQLVKRLFGK